MRALRYHGPGDIRLEMDIPEPECRVHQVKICPSFCGICGTDLHVYQSSNSLPFKDTPHPITGEKWPVTLGHEFSGEVVEVGSEVRNGIRVGDRVAVQPTICCNQCVPCKEGLTNCCDSFGFVGLMGWGGGLSDYVCVDARFAFKLPDTIPSDIGALVEPLAVAWHAVALSALKAGDDVLVMGAGPIGLAVIQCLKARQPGQLIVAEVAANRRKFAQQFGATAVIDPREQDVVSTCKLLCDGQGPAMAFDCAGVAASIKSACLATRSGGTVVNVSVWDGDIPFNMNNLLFGEKRLLTALSYTTADFEAVIHALDNGSIDAKDMITRTITIDRVVENGIMALTHHKDRDIKIVVDVAAR
ncbi:chaperonin 10-like protein [Pseudomassariella vexata]|uniref:Chaperonin 10-like protein n=1 Tax=Pseudomassariella vexata TaxID=1141098 RepID=A0A1Y2EJI8_9PEZI|nr:chaperonin 10-like protein [Pseudomassariella vexata]ORY71436.1 chaperonin 10-like protein [Pseudomassariella vexata]